MRHRSRNAKKLAIIFTGIWNQAVDLACACLPLLLTMRKGKEVASCSPRRKQFGGLVAEVVGVNGRDREIA
jgi:hypothetical protein